MGKDVQIMRNWEPKAARIEGWMKMGPDYEQTWRGWQVHADPAEDRIPVTILVPRGFKLPKEQV